MASAGNRAARMRSLSSRTPSSRWASAQARVDLPVPGRPAKAISMASLGGPCRTIRRPAVSTGRGGGVQSIFMNTLRLVNGRVLDPSQHLDQVTELWLRGERILGLGPQPHWQADQTIDVAGKLVCPGLIDMHVHLREPGRE